MPPFGSAFEREPSAIFRLTLRAGHRFIAYSPHRFLTFPAIVTRPPGLISRRNVEFAPTGWEARQCLFDPHFPVGIPQGAPAPGKGALGLGIITSITPAALKATACGRHRKAAGHGAPHRCDQRHDEQHRPRRCHCTKGSRDGDREQVGTAEARARAQAVALLTDHWSEVCPAPVVLAPAPVPGDSPQECPSHQALHSPVPG